MMYYLHKNIFSHKKTLTENNIIIIERIQGLKSFSNVSLLPFAWFVKENKTLYKVSRQVINYIYYINIRPRSSVSRVTVDLIRRSWVRFPPRSKDFSFTSCGSLIPFTRVNAQWVIHGFN